MNVKRGLFRIWVVASGMFVISAALLGWNPVQREFEKAEFEAVWKSDPLAVPLFCEDARGTLGKDYSVNNGKSWASAKDTCWYAMPTVRKLFPEFSKLTDDELTTSTFKTVGEDLPKKTDYKDAQPWWMIASLAALAVGVPFAILAFGSAIYWALAGFARKPQAGP